MSGDKWTESKDFKILSSEYHACGQATNDLGLLQKLVLDHLQRGYSLVGVPYASGGFQYQAVQK